MSDEAEALLASGVVERLGQPDGRFWLGSPHGETLADMSGEYPEHRAAVRQVFDSLEKHGFSAPDAVGHRLVHGGPDHTGPQRIDASLLAALRRLIRSEEHTSELQSQFHLVCRLLLEKKKKKK